MDKIAEPGVRFADPTSKEAVRFPFNGPIPSRFKVDDRLDFVYFGRSTFRTLFETVKRMNVITNRRIYLHGLLGAGKSHLVAALVVAVKKEPGLNFFVCYIPDCYELVMGNASEFIARALCSAFCSEPEEEGGFRTEMAKLLEDLGSLTVEMQELSLRAFCSRVAYCKKTILFIIDQANALDDDAEGDRVPNAKKAQLRVLLDEISHQHLKVESSTALNYRAGKYYDLLRNNHSEKRILLNTGLDDVKLPQGPAKRVYVLSTDVAGLERNDVLVGNGLARVEMGYLPDRQALPRAAYGTDADSVIRAEEFSPSNA